MRNDLPRVLPIARREPHSANACSLRIGYECAFLPGQFVMVWLPGVDEKPFSVSAHGPDWIELTVKRLGPVSGQLIDLPEGGLVGVRGPYGRSFDLESECVIVGGGVGIAAVAPLIERFPHAPVLYGENSAPDFMLTQRFPHMRLFSIDGSRGERGFPTDPLPELLDRRKPKIVYACGPEVMLAKVARIAREAGVRSQISLERYMKCAMGVCGQCCMDGRRVCVDGPVFDGAALLEARDFGFRRLDKSGTWIPLGRR